MPPTPSANSSWPDVELIPPVCAAAGRAPLTGLPMFAKLTVIVPAPDAVVEMREMVPCGPTTTSTGIASLPNTGLVVTPARLAAGSSAANVDLPMVAW